MTAQNVVDMLKARGVIDEGVAYDISHEAVEGGKDRRIGGHLRHILFLSG